MIADAAAAQVMVNWRDLHPLDSFRLASLSGERNKLNFDFNLVIFIFRIFFVCVRLTSSALQQWFFFNWTILEFALLISHYRSYVVNNDRLNNS